MFRCEFVPKLKHDQQDCKTKSAHIMKYNCKFYLTNGKLLLDAFALSLWFKTNHEYYLTPALLCFIRFRSNFKEGRGVVHELVAWHIMIRQSRICTSVFLISQMLIFSKILFWLSQVEVVFSRVYIITPTIHDDIWKWNYAYRCFFRCSLA